MRCLILNYEMNDKTLEFIHRNLPVERNKKQKADYSKMVKTLKVLKPLKNTP